MTVVRNDVEQLHERDAPNDWRLGFILIRSGRLKVEDVTRIISRQQERGIRFGDAAVELGMLQDSDIRFALAQQFDHSYVTPGKSGITNDVIAAYEPDSLATERVRALRTYLTHRWFNAVNSHSKMLAVAGPDRGAGRSWIAANLAVTFSQLGRKTVLVDADLRHPRQHTLFGLNNRHGLSQVLSNRIKLTSAIQHNNEVLPFLTVITAGAVPPNPQEVIARGTFQQLLDTLSAKADVIIVDTPAGNEGADGQIIAGYTGGAILVAKKNITSVQPFSGYMKTLAATGVSLILSVLVE